MFIALILASSFLCKALLRFKINPTFTSIVLNENNMKVSYPSIDVCPLNAIDVSKVNQAIAFFSDNSNQQNDDEISLLIPNFKAHISENISDIQFNSTILRKFSEYFKTDDLRVLALKLSIECSNLIKNCNYKGRPIDCCLNFLPRLSEHGLCYSFNSRSYGIQLNE